MVIGAIPAAGQSVFILLCFVAFHLTLRYCFFHLSIFAFSSLYLFLSFFLLFLLFFLFFSLFISLFFASFFSFLLFSLLCLSFRLSLDFFSLFFSFVCEYSKLLFFPLLLSLLQFCWNWMKRFCRTSKKKMNRNGYFAEYNTLQKRSLKQETINFAVYLLNSNIKRT